MNIMYFMSKVFIFDNNYYFYILADDDSDWDSKHVLIVKQQQEQQPQFYDYGTNPIPIYLPSSLLVYLDPIIGVSSCSKI